MSDKMEFLVIFIFLLPCFNLVTSSCTFPSTLEGQWDSPSKGNLTINSTHISGYDVYTYTTLTFECHIKDGSNYVIRSDEFTVLGGGNQVNAVTCLKFTVQTSLKYVYYLLSTELSDANYERVKFVSVSDVVNSSYVCDDTGAANTIQNSRIFIKKDQAASAAQLCSQNLLGSFYHVNGTTCSTNGSWDACNPNTEMNFNYTSCTTKQAFSMNGSVYCVHTESSNNVYVTYVYNKDASPDGTTYYQFSCMVSETSTSTGYVEVTTSPKACYSNQTATYVPGSGTSITLAANITCVPPTDKNEVNTATIAAVVVVVLVVVIVGLVAGYFIYTKKFKKVSAHEKVIDKEKSAVSSDSFDRNTDAVTPSVVQADVTSPRNGASHGKLTQVLGREYTMSNVPDDNKALADVDMQKNKLPPITTGDTPREAVSPLDTQLQRPALPGI